MVLASCTGGGSSTATDSATTSQPDPATTAPITTVAEPPPPLSHGQFIKRLDRICRTSNRQIEQRFGAKEDAAIAANDYDRLADLMQQAKRLDRPFYRAVREFGQRVPDEDERGLRRYLSLSHELDVFRARYIRALRKHDDDELARLDALYEHTRNQRTRVTARMGLKQCGS